MSVYLPSPAVDDQRPAIAAEGDRGTSPFQPMRAPQAMFPGNGLAGIGVIDEQGVGRLLVVVKMMFAAHCRDLRWIIDGQSPAGDVEQMHAPVAELASAVIPEPVPVVMETIRIERSRGSRPQPQIVVERRGRRGVFLEADRLSLMNRPGLRQMDAAEPAALNILDRRAEVLARA